MTLGKQLCALHAFLIFKMGMEIIHQQVVEDQMRQCVHSNWLSVCSTLESEVLSPNFVQNQKEMKSRSPKLKNCLLHLLIHLTVNMH